RIDIGDAFKYEIIQSDTYSISITADDNLFDDIRVTQSGEELKIDLKPLFRFNVTGLEAVVTMPRLTGLESSGATRGSVTGFSSGDNLELDISGASRVKMTDMTVGDIEGSVTGASTLEADVIAGNIDLGISGASRVEGSLEARDVIVDLSGASRIETDGSGSNTKIDASGASTVKFGDFSVDNADVSLSGASTCKIRVTGRIDIDLSGASRLTYVGNPVLGSIDLSGGSTVNSETED
ncbi:MAG: DUF2807 domain-containing protein, partial [Dehalococcoidia bacterium]